MARIVQRVTQPVARVWVRWLVVALTVCSPVLVALGLTLSADRALTDLTPDWTPIFVPIESRAAEVSAQATLRAHTAPPGSLVTTTQSGTVTAVWLAEGDLLLGGKRLLDVDGVGIVAYTPKQGAVFYRDLCRGDTGPDVALLQEFLIQLGFYHGNADGTFGSGTASGVIAFDRSLGVAGPSGCFTTARVVLVPPGVVAAGTIEVALGDVLSAPASVIVEAALTVTEASLDTPGFSGPDGEYVAEFSGEVVPLTREGGIWALDLTVLSDSLRKASVADGVIELTVHVRSAAPLDVQLFPSSAPFVTLDGAYCVGLEASSGDGSITYIRIQPISLATIDAVAIEPIAELDGQKVLANPPPSASARSCH